MINNEQFFRGKETKIEKKIYVLVYSKEDTNIL